MWEVENLTPFAADCAWVRDRDGAEVWLVIVKATFLIGPDGVLTEAKEQVPVMQLPVWRGEPAKSSLLYDSDIYHTKPTTDIILNGHAYAPRGQPVRQCDVTMRVGSLTKTLRIIGDRRWRSGIVGLTASDPEPFVKMPLTYERAYGGADPKTAESDRPKFEPRNPVGRGFMPAADQPVFNIEQAKAGLGSSLHGIAPAGFGAIAPHWQPRVQYSGTYDDEWHKRRCPLLPRDFDERFYLCSPEDQRPPQHLKGGELVELTNLTPSGTLRFHLPRLAFGFETWFLPKERVLHRGVLHTVILEPDVPRVILVWHTHLPCHPKVLKLDRTFVTRKRILNPPPGQTEPIEEDE